MVLSGSCHCTVSIPTVFTTSLINPVASTDLNRWDFTVVPRGFDCPTCAWMANGGGDYYSPAFVTQNAGTGIPDCLGGHPGQQIDASIAAACSPAGDFQFPMENYTTAVVGNVSIEWITKIVSDTKGPPFFAYVAPKAAHGTSYIQRTTRSALSLFSCRANYVLGRRTFQSGAMVSRSLGRLVAKHRASTSIMELLGCVTQEPPRKYRDGRYDDLSGSSGRHRNI
eukprot:COSAG02_NODE_644_length_18993_cov_6.626389_10_plen_225_part_00